MQSLDDSALLRQYVEFHSDEAFAALVTRHINLIYSVAMRSVRDPHLAEEVTQAVFIILAKKAAQLRHEKALSSWLFQTTRLTAGNFIRSEIRRHRREQEAHMQSVFDDSGSDIWPRISPLLDDAVAALSDKERQAIVLRFYDGRSLQEVSAVFEASEDAVEKRISRAVDKLREFFIKRGVSIGGSGLAVVLSANAVQAAPVGLASTVSIATAGTVVAAAIANRSARNLMHRLFLVAAIAACAVALFSVYHHSNSPTMPRSETVQNPSVQQSARTQSTTLTNALIPEPRSPEYWDALNKMAGGKVKDAIVLSTALTQYVAKERGPLPSSFDQVAPFMINLPALSGTNDFEILSSGTFDEMKRMQLISVAIIRDRHVWTTPSGKRARVYGMLGGVAEIIETDDNFQTWEARHVLGSPRTDE